MNRAPAALACLALAVVPAGAGGDSPALADWQAELAAHRAAREERLARPDGWLTLVGLEWLTPGQVRVGAAAANDVVLPGGPAHWGDIRLTGDGIATFTPAPGAAVTVDGQPRSAPVTLVPDTAGTPTVIRGGTLSVQLIERVGSFALRVRDSDAPYRLAFDGLDFYPPDPTWRVSGAFQRAPAGATVEIANVVGQVEPTPLYGTFSFERDGARYQLLALGDTDSDSVWILFADRTNGRGSYGAGRFVYSEGMPEAGTLVVDFNKAYNPPCAFSDYSTCPLPPPENRLDLAVRAGERDAPH